MKVPPNEEESTLSVDLFSREEFPQNITFSRTAENNTSIQWVGPLHTILKNKPDKDYLRIKPVKYSHRLMKSYQICLSILQDKSLPYSQKLMI